MADSSAPIRSYQRIFAPDRRIYQVDGRRLPIPGGVPLSWLGWAFGALAAILALSARSIAVAVAVAALGALLGGGTRGFSGALLGAAAGFAGTLLAGVLLGWLPWPLRLLILPAMVATLVGQTSPDGRPAHRYLASVVGLRLRAERRSLDRALSPEGQEQVWAPGVWLARDHHSAVLERGRVQGPARLVFLRPVVVVPGRRRDVVRPAAGHRLRQGERLIDALELAAGQVVEVRS